MGFPPGMVLNTIAFGIPLTATGKDVVTKVTVKPTSRVIWAATGQPLPEFSDSFTAEAGQLGQFQVPAVDQPGFIDSAGNAVTDFAYQISASWEYANERPIAWSKNLKPLQAQSGIIDLDLVPDGPVSIPVTAPTAAVLGFGGRTGYVTLQESDLPARLAVDQLNATFVPKWKPTTAYLAGDKVLSPAGDVVSAIANFTSGASYNAANWSYSPTYTKQEKGAGRFIGKLSGWAPATTALFIGDSTGNWLGEWIDLTLRGIGAAYPSLTTKWHLWQEGPVTYGINDTVQTGAQLDVITDTFTRTAGALEGTKPDVGNALWVGPGWSVDGAKAVWGSGSTMMKIDSGLAGDFEADWSFVVTPTAATTGQTFRFVARLNTLETVRLYGEITASTTAAWTLRLFKKMASANTSIGAIPINGLDINWGLGSPVTVPVKMKLTGDQLSVSVNNAVNTIALTATLTSADLAELAGGTSYAVQGGIVSAKIDSFNVKTRQPESVLHFYNASIAGAGIPFFTSAMLDTMTPADDVDLIVFNLAHNAGAADGETYGPTYEAFIDATARRFPRAGIAVSSQNPEMHGTLTTYPAAQFSRNAWIKEMCARRGFTYIPGMEAFMGAANPYKYVKADGMHPTDTAEHPTDHGQQLWANAALAQLKLRGLTRLP